MVDTQATGDGRTAAIATADLKPSRANVTLSRLQAARKAGHTALTVTNNDRPILYLGYEEDLPEQWRSDDIQCVPFSDMRTSKVSLLALRRERRPLYLSQQGKKPTLALWPLEQDNSKLEKESVRPTVNLEAENASLRRRMAKLERRVEFIEKNMELAGTTLARLFRREDVSRSK
jgi:PHD/YefM family antitoxin component YafN of YafNO toxin-antitoxin module